MATNISYRKACGNHFTICSDVSFSIKDGNHKWGFQLCYILIVIVYAGSARSHIYFQ